jgi:hypothetical protein
MEIGFWRDISVVLLVLEAFILSLIPLVVVYFLGRGVTYVLRETPGVFAQIRGGLTQVHDMVAQITEQIVAPVLAVARTVAQIRGILAGVRKQFRWQ